MKTKKKQTYQVTITRDEKNNVEVEDVKQVKSVVGSLIKRKSVDKRNFTRKFLNNVDHFSTK